MQINQGQSEAEKFWNFGAKLVLTQQEYTNERIKQKIKSVDNGYKDLELELRISNT